MAWDRVRHFDREQLMVSKARLLHPPLLINSSNIEIPGENAMRIQR